MKLSRYEDPVYLLDVFDAIGMTLEDRAKVDKEYGALSIEYGDELDPNTKDKDPDVVAAVVVEATKSQLASEDMFNQDMAFIEQRLRYIVCHLGGLVSARALEEARDLFIERADSDSEEDNLRLLANKYARFLIMGTFVNEHAPDKLDIVIKDLGKAGTAHSAAVSTGKPVMDISRLCGLADKDEPVRIVEGEDIGNGYVWVSLTSPRSVEAKSLGSKIDRVITKYRIVDIMPNTVDEVTVIVEVATKKYDSITFAPDSDIFRLSQDGKHLELYMPAGRLGLLDSGIVFLSLQSAHQDGVSLQATGSGRRHVITTFRPVLNRKGQCIVSPHPVSVSMRT